MIASLNPQQLNWDNLRVFLVVARKQSALEASSTLALDNSTITRRIKRLEQEMGCQLFERTPQGHQLTSAGHRLLEYVEKIESTLSQVETDLGGANHVLTGQVRLGATEGLGSFFLAPHLARFCEQHPAMNVELLAVPRFVNLSRREADLAVNIERPQSASHVACKLTDYRLQLYATRGYLEAHPPIRSLEDLAQHPFIGYVEELAFSDELRYREQLAPGTAASLRSTSVVAQLQATRQGRALAILPCFLGNTAEDLIPVLPGIAEVIRSFWLMAPADRRELARVRAVWDYLRHIVDINRDYLMGNTRRLTWASFS